MSSLTTVAEELVKAVSGDLTSKNVAGVVKVLDSILNKRDNEWEDHLRASINEIIFQENINCTVCGTPIQVESTSREVVVTDL